MRASLQKGSALEGVMILIFLATIIFVFIIPGSKNGRSFSIFTVTNSNATSYSNNSPLTPTRTSYYSRSVSIGTGNASGSYQAYEEYITLRNDSDKPIDITGWSLQNGKGSRLYTVGGAETHFSSDIAIIPRGALLPTGIPTTDIILQPGDEAYVTTGSVGGNYPYKISSFKENECSGYLADTSTYQYTWSPYINASCVYPSQEPGLRNLDTQCQDFAKNLQSCRAPKFDAIDSQGHVRDSRGNTCVGCVNGVGGLSNSCVAYLQNHFTYEGCLINHQNDPHFYSNIWHVYLGRQFELWAKDHETISLFDTSGKLVDYLSY